MGHKITSIWFLLVAIFFKIWMPINDVVILTVFAISVIFMIAGIYEERNN